MKKIKVILFSFLLMLSCLLIPNKVLADSLPANQITFSENYSTLANKKQSLDNKIAQVEGTLLGKPWEGLDSVPPVDIIKQWRCNRNLGKYVSLVNFDEDESYSVWIKHIVFNVNDPSEFTEIFEYRMEPSSKQNLGCTVSLGYDDEPSFLHTWKIDHYESI